MSFPGRDVHTFFSSGPGTLVDFRGRSGRVRIAARLRMTAEVMSGRSHYNRFPNQIEHIVSLNQVLYDEDSERVRAAAAVAALANASVCAIITPFGGYAGGIVPADIPLTQPFAERSSVNVTFPSDGMWVFGALSSVLAVAGSLAVNIDHNPAAIPDAVYVLVQGAAAAEDAHLSIIGGGDSDAFPALDGIYLVTGLHVGYSQIKPSQELDQPLTAQVIYGNRIGPA